MLTILCQWLLFELDVVFPPLAPRPSVGHCVDGLRLPVLYSPAAIGDLLPLGKAKVSCSLSKLEDPLVLQVITSGPRYSLVEVQSPRLQHDEEVV